MNWAIILLGIVIAAVSAGTIAAYEGTSRYTINGVRYDVPHKYEFMRQFNLPWLNAVKGLDADDPESVALLLPADDIAGSVRGYHPTFHGYDSEVPADMVVTVTGGKDAREFPSDRLAMLAQDEEQRKQDGIAREVPDSETGMTRAILATGNDGDWEWDLRPINGTLQQNWRPPSCLGSHDVKGRPTYDCTFWIQQDGLTFEFLLREGNLNTAQQIPTFVLQRMARWRVK